MWHVHCDMIKDCWKEDDRSAYFHFTLRNIPIRLHYSTDDFSDVKSSLTVTKNSLTSYKLVHRDVSQLQLMQDV